ncbi:hypothetical protein Bbelb_282690 [Branchiostoma belcheri]|nr:hypothetical protein Bbelb_282690 [Branchiostoma belcheri]
MGQGKQTHHCTPNCAERTWRNLIKLETDCPHHKRANAPYYTRYVHVRASVICYCSKCGSKYVSERKKLRSEEAAPGSSGETSHFLEDENDERNRPIIYNGSSSKWRSAEAKPQHDNWNRWRSPPGGMAWKSYTAFHTMIQSRAVPWSRCIPYRMTLFGLLEMDEDQHGESKTIYSTGKLPIKYTTRHAEIGRYYISVPFKGGRNEGRFLYVPEVDTITNRQHHEREDHNHIIKRVAKHTRDDGRADINVRRLEEAMTLLISRTTEH